MLIDNINIVLYLVILIYTFMLCYGYYVKLIQSFTYCAVIYYKVCIEWHWGTQCIYSIDTDFAINWQYSHLTSYKY